MKSKDEIDREISEYVSTHQGESNDQSMFLKNGQYIFQNNENNDTPEEPFLKSVNRAVIPRDKSLYPGFPNTEGWSFCLFRVSRRLGSNLLSNYVPFIGWKYNFFVFLLV